MSQNMLGAYIRALEDILPMPADDAPQMKPGLIDHYVELVKSIARELDTRFDARALSVLVRSFGVGDGFEAYWTTVHIIERFYAREETYALIRAGVGDDAPGVRQWCCLLLGRRRDLLDLPLLIARLGDSAENVVIEALSSIRMVVQTNTVPAAIPAVVALLNDPRPAVVAKAQRVLQALEPSSGAAT